MKKIAFVTLFPDWIRSSLGHSIMARAESSGFVEFSVVNPRSFCYDPHKKVDDIPYGGHPGMLIKAEPVALAIEAILRDQGSGIRDQSLQPAVGSLQIEPAVITSSREVSELIGTDRHDDDSAKIETSTDQGTSLAREVGEVRTGRVEPSPQTSAEQFSSLAREVGERSTSKPGEAIEQGEEKPLTPQPPLPKGGEGETPNSQLLTPNSKTAIVITEPSGVPFSQANAEELSAYDQVIFVCGHYEGIDHRIEETYATHVFSIGDYVLTNGELPALVMADAVTRLIPGVLGNENSLDEESFQNNLLGAPNYTRPEVWRGKPIPDVLKSGNHKLIEKWRLAQAKERTQARRPDMLDKSNQ